MAPAEFGAAIPTARPQALLVSPAIEDEVLLTQLFREQGWKLSTAKTLPAARAFLRENTIPLAITEQDLPAGNWKDLMIEIQDLPRPPLLVVMSRLADERLWSEVLNFCGHDVLIKPLCQSEAVRIFNHAFHHWYSPRAMKRAAMGE